jgi:hypothetical protein
MKDRVQATTIEAAVSVSECANPACKARFQRLGTGQLFVFPISNAEEWNLPPHAKQKVVWLCGECREHMYVRLDRKKRIAQIVRKRASKIAAA